LCFSSKGRNIQIWDRGALRKFITDTDPLDEIKKIMKGFVPAKIKGLARFYGGFVGYIGYDYVRFIEKIPDKNPDELNVPDTFLILTDKILLFDHINHTLKIIVNVILPSKGRPLSLAARLRLYRDAIRQIEAINKDFRLPVRASGLDASAGRFVAGLKHGANISQAKNANISSNFEKSQFCGIVNKAKEYIKAGDIIQVVLSQRFKARCTREPFDIYRSLRGLNPSPYMFFLHLDRVILIGASPELLVRCENGLIQARPIAGTRSAAKPTRKNKMLEMNFLMTLKKGRASYAVD